MPALPAGLTQIGTTLSSKLPEGLKKSLPLVLVAVVAVALLFTVLCLLGWSAKFAAKLCSGDLCEESDGNDDFTVADYSFGKNVNGVQTDGGGAAIFAFFSVLINVAITSAAMFFVIPNNNKNYAIAFYLLCVGTILVFFSFFYFLPRDQSIGPISTTVTPKVTWGFVFAILSVFIYLPAVPLTLVVAGTAEAGAGTTTATPVATATTAVPMAIPVAAAADPV